MLRACRRQQAKSAADVYKRQGLSLGREGPSIQLGAMVGKGFSRLTNKLRTEEKMLMTCGAGAGLAGAFSAPLAGVVFSLEELHRCV